MKSFYIFDFCETIVGCQTGDMFIKFCLNKKKKYLSTFLFYFYCSFPFLIYNRLLGKVSPKTLKVKLLKGIDKEELEFFSKEFSIYLRANFLFREVYDFLLNKSENNCVVVISGGYSCYIERFFEDLNNVDVIATELEFEESRLTGKIAGLDCLGSNKIAKLRSRYNLKTIFTEFDASYFYSDHISDLPLLLIVDYGVVISRGAEQEWAKKFNFNQWVIK